MKKKLKKYIVFIIFVIVLILFLLFPINEAYIERTKINDYGIIDDITKEDYIVQEFVSKKNYDSFGFRFANYAEFIRNGKIDINIKDKTTNKNKKIDIELNKLQDNEIMYINYKLKKNHEYSITMSSDSNKKITFYSLMDNDNNTKLYINDEFQQKDLEIVFKYYKKKYSFTWYYCLALSLYLSYLSLKVGDKK